MPDWAVRLELGRRWLGQDLFTLFALDVRSLSKDLLFEITSRFHVTGGLSACVARLAVRGNHSGRLAELAAKDKLGKRLALPCRQVALL